MEKIVLFLCICLCICLCLVGCSKVDVPSIIDAKIESSFDGKSEEYKNAYLEKFSYTINSEENIDKETIKVNISVTQKSIKEVCGLSIKKQFANAMNSDYTNEQAMIDAFNEVETISTDDYDVELKLIDGKWTITDTTFLFDTTK